MFNKPSEVFGRLILSPKVVLLAEILYTNSEAEVKAGLKKEYGTCGLNFA
jgi:hypothetical protein